MLMDRKAFFLSHSSRDKAIVRELASHFPKSLTVWLDERELTVGQPLESTLNQAVDASPFTIAFLSDTSLASDWVQLELKAAMNREDRTGVTTVLPVVLGAVKTPLPDFVASRRYLTIAEPTERAIKAAADAILDGVVAILCSNDPVVGAKKEALQTIMAKAVARHEGARTGELHKVGELATEAIVTVQAVLQAMYRWVVTGAITKDCPPLWLRDYQENAARYWQNSSPEGIALGELLVKPLGQVFLIGYYCTAARRAWFHIPLPSWPKDVDSTDFGATLSTIVREIYARKCRAPVDWCDDGIDDAVYLAQDLTRIIATNTNPSNPIGRLFLHVAFNGVNIAVAEEVLHRRSTEKAV